MTGLFLLSWGVRSYLQSFFYNENIVLVVNNDTDSVVCLKCIVMRDDVIWNVYKD